MADYYQAILNSLLDSYEKRGAFKKSPSQIKAVQINPAKKYKEYTDRYNHEAYRDINIAIGKMEVANLVEVTRDMAGRYIRVKLNLGQVDRAYQAAQRESVPALCDKIKAVLAGYQDQNQAIIQRLVCDFRANIGQYKKLPYGIDFDWQKLESMLEVLTSIVGLNQETYIRNFSTAIFKDSKLFQKEYRTNVENILFDYTEDVVEKDRILEVYHLFDNPTYVLIKGNARIIYEDSDINLEDLKGGLAIPNSALGDLKRIEVKAQRLISVENLTTYHDSQEANSMFIYLGGFHNLPKQEFLKRLYQQNPDKDYYHKGDIDVYGFLILENLISKTGIPFQPLEMDLAMLQRFFARGLYKPLTPKEKKIMKSEKLSKYQEVFDFMLAHNCKAEQESAKVLELIEIM